MVTAHAFKASALVPQRSDRPIILSNARIFDGTHQELRQGMKVLIRAGKIEAIDAGIALAAEAQVIDCGGRVLMPGLIDAHFHSMFASLPANLALSEGLDYISLVAAQNAEATLLRGYTTVRDVGGLSFGLKRAIDEGRVAGPRIYPSGLALSQTGGHGDMRSSAEVPREPNSPYTPGELYYAVIADGVDAVIRATREQLLKGASQIKVLAGGGIASLRDPLDSLQYSLEEIRAAVNAAADWGTYVTVHAYAPASIRRSIEGGVQCIEHGHLADEDTARLMRDKDIWWSLQPFLPTKAEGDLPDARQQQKLDMVLQGTHNAYNLAKKYNIKTAFGTDYAFNPAGAAKQNVRLAALRRWRTPYEALRMATADNASLLALSGRRNPYDAPIGRVEPGACADLLLVDGEPLNDLELFVDADKNLRLIMKDGRIFKQTI
jgi:imidazolonepropionase-like amidohydrolase